ncbi:MAG: glycine--tRNA ligase subunit beta [Acidiferrobacteraceae bacterium]
MSRSSRADLLLEIGTEELPPNSLQALSLALAESLKGRLLEARVCEDDADVHPFASPRRLGVIVSGVLRRQPARLVEKRGPAVTAAYDRNGQPTPAAEGFARSCGVALARLKTVRNDKGEWLSFSMRIAGQGISRLLAEILPQVVGSLPVAKRMRWGAAEEEFVRPVHWITLLHGSTAIRMPLLSVMTGRMTRGHRFMAPKAVSIPDASRYQDLLRERFVIADLSERAEVIAKHAERLAQEHGLKVLLAPDALNEVAGLVEWPEPVLGAFAPEFLALPPEVLMTAMQRHQKYFPVTDAEGRLAARFMAVANIRSTTPDSVRAGNERVLAARFSDARFFWETDRKHTLESRVAGLASVSFQEQLGSMADKTQRVRALAVSIAPREQAAMVDRAAWLAKADLLTGMVGEFPELQGVMGRYYAAADGEHEAVARAIETHYAPRNAAEAPCRDAVGAIVGLSDRIDSLIGMFAVGLAPSGDKDPFGLRRQALAVVRILTERGEFFEPERVGLSGLLSRAASLYPVALGAAGAIEKVHAFILERVRSHLAPRFAPDEIEALLSGKPDRLDDLEQRALAIRGFRGSPQASDVITANKRIRNILRQAGGTAGEPDAGLYLEDSERELGRAWANAERDVRTLLSAGRFGDALARLGDLGQPLARFFDTVMVLADDTRVRENRLRLLGRLQKLFLEVADLSQLRE